jgi:hypothetical protein
MGEKICTSNWVKNEGSHAVPKGTPEMSHPKDTAFLFKTLLFVLFGKQVGCGVACVAGLILPGRLVTSCAVQKLANFAVRLS